MNSGRPSPVDSPYTNARSPSGHLIPFSPTPARHYSGGHILPWMAGSQASLHDEPSSIDRHTPNTDSPLQTNSSAIVYTRHSDTPLGPDIDTHQPHLDRAMEASSGNPGVNSVSQSAHSHFHASALGHLRGTPYSIKSSSQLSVSQKSYNSRCSTGRASYREHRGPPARDHTPAPEKAAHTFSSPSSYTLEVAEPEGSAVPTPVVALPSAGDPNTPGEPTIPGHRFYPMSVSGAIRYDNRNTK